MSAAVGFLERISGLNVEPEISSRPPRHQGRTLRKVFNSKLAQQQQKMTPSFQVPGSDVRQRSLQVRAGMACFTASPATFLPLGPLRLAWATHLRLPVFQMGQRCMYRPLATVLPCLPLSASTAATCTGAPMDPSSAVTTVCVMSGCPF